MKKILLSLLMLCSMMTAWAEGTGDGSKENPYSGEWQVAELKSQLKKGDYLAYDCVINNGSITVYDDSLMVKIARNWIEWAVADAIDETPFSIYDEGSDYCSIYSLEDRKSHTFQITGFIELNPKSDEEAGDDDIIAITGHYSGTYISGDNSQGYHNKSSVYVDSIGKICVHNAKELRDSIERYGKDPNAIIQIMNDIDMSEFEHLTEPHDDAGFIFKAQLCGSYNMKYPNGDLVTDMHDNVMVGKFALSKLNLFLFGKCEDAKIEGIMFKDADISNPLKYRASQICCEARNTEFNDITIFNCRYEDEFFMKHVPGLSLIIDWFTDLNYAGQLATEMYDCKVKGVYVMGSELYMEGSGVGNIAGYAERTTFEDCFADAGSTVFVEVSTNAYAGGLVGRCLDCTFKDCSNMSTVCGSEKADNVGGICGESKNCTFENCYNGGVLAQAERGTWIAATLRNSYDILSSIKTIAGFHPIEVGKEIIRDFQILCTNTTNVTDIELLLDRMAAIATYKMEEDFFTVFTRYTSLVSLGVAIYTITFNLVVAINDPDEIGGISAAAYGCSFNQCMNGGRIFCRDAYAGGIVGRAGTKSGKKTTFNECINIGYVQGTEQVGGIVGCMEDDGEIRNCLNTSTIDGKEKETTGSIYGEKTSNTTVRNCFALTHDAEDHTGSLSGGGGVTKVSYRDVLSGLVACELNRLSGTKDFCQIVGKQPYPTFFGSKTIEEKNIDKDVDRVYKVADLGGFINAIFNQYADIELLDDINFDNSFFSVYRPETPFRGTIDGKGKSLSNIRTEGADLGSVTSGYYAMIGAAEGATFKNISLDNCFMEFPGTSAGLVCNSTGCKYENVHLTGGTAIIVKGARVGGIVCNSNGDSLNNCSVENGCVIVAGRYPNGIYSEVGGIAYIADKSQFIDCCNKGRVMGEAGDVGGIVSFSKQCNFTRCVNDKSAIVEIQKQSQNFEIKTEGGHGAGIAAFAIDSDFRMCANYGKVDARYTETGGIVGYGKGVYVINCLNSSGNLAFGDNVSTAGSIIGKAEDHSMVSNCAATQDGKYPMIGEWTDMQRTAGHNYKIGNRVGERAGHWEMLATKSDFENGKVCYWLNEGKDGPWHQNGTELTLNSEGSPMTLGDIVNENRSDVFKIYNAEDLKAFAEHVNSVNQFACAILMNDINMANQEFTPIGKNADNKHFRGIFDGRGHTIDSLTVKSNEPVGLFGAVHGHAEIYNVTIGKGSKFENTGGNNGLGDEGAGGIVGRLASSWKWGDVRIRNCGSYADIKVNKHGGGIFGRITTEEENCIEVFIDNCFSMGTITAQNGNSGLLSGYMKDNGNVSNCWSAGQLRTMNSTYPFSIENPYAADGESELLVGYNRLLDITNCYVIDPDHNVDKWDKGKYQGGVTILKDPDDLTSGKLAYLLNGEDNDATKALVWEQNLGTDGNPVFGSKGVYHARSVSQKDYGTICVPYPLETLKGVGSSKREYYLFDSVKDEADGTMSLCFKYTDVVPAGTPAIFRAYVNSTYEFKSMNNELLFGEIHPAVCSGWIFKGTYKQQVFDGVEAESIYYLNGARDNSAIKNAKKTTIDPYRAYFEGPNIYDLIGNETSQAKTIRFVIEDEDGTATALELVGDDLMPTPTPNLNGVYNLAGQKVGDSYRGIVIKNGKKVMVK